MLKHHLEQCLLTWLPSRQAVIPPPSPSSPNMTLSSYACNEESVGIMLLRVFFNRLIALFVISDEKLYVFLVQF